MAGGDEAGAGVPGAEEEARPPPCAPEEPPSGMAGVQAGVGAGGVLPPARRASWVKKRAAVQTCSTRGGVQGKMAPPQRKRGTAADRAVRPAVCAEAPGKWRTRPECTRAEVADGGGALSAGKRFVPHARACGCDGLPPESCAGSRREVRPWGQESEGGRRGVGRGSFTNVATPLSPPGPQSPQWGGQDRLAVWGPGCPVRALPAEIRGADGDLVSPLAAALSARGDSSAREAARGPRPTSLTAAAQPPETAPGC